MQYANEYIFADGYSRMYIPQMSAQKTKTIGDRLDEAMRGKFNQSELARASGVPQATISRILKGGGKKGPETETIRRLATACGVTFEWLNEGVRSVPTPEPDNSVVPAQEAIELVTAYLEADPKDRKSIMNLAKAAAERAARRAGRAIGNQS